jgi:ADP-heptose:LPS heptosyltransferase
VRPRLVVLRALGLGDFLTAVPALRALAAAFADHHRVLLAPAWLEPLAALLDGAVDEVVDTEGRAAVPGVLPPAARGAAVAVNLHGRGPQSHAALRAARPGRLVAFACAAAGHDDGPAWREAEHEVARWCRLLREHLAGVGEAPPVWTLLPAPPPVQPGATVVHPGAASGSRRWPVERWAAVVRALSTDGHRVVVTGTPAEQALVDAVAGAAGAASAIDLDVDGLFGLIAAARLLLSGDTGVAHVASAFGTPSVVLFGPVSPACWGPPPRARHQALWPAPDPGYRGDPHGSDPDPVLLRIPVADVLAAAGRADVRKISPAGSRVAAPGGS